MRHRPHNAQTVLDLSEDEDYIYVKSTLATYETIREKLESEADRIQYWEEGFTFFGKRKMLRRKFVSRLNRAAKAFRELASELCSETWKIEDGIINAALSRPIAPRKVNLMGIQNSNNVSINDDPDYDAKEFNPQRSAWMQNREGIKK